MSQVRIGVGGRAERGSQPGVQRYLQARRPTYRFVSGQQPVAALPSAPHPRRPRPDGAAFGGSARPCRRGRGAVAPEGFSGRFWGGADEVTGGVCTLAGDFHALLWDVEGCLLLKDPYLLSWDGLLEIRV